MSYCFLEHGMTPRAFTKLEEKEKVLMIAALQIRRKHEKQAEKEAKKK